jgi:hypothetical protein
MEIKTTTNSSGIDRQCDECGEVATLAASFHHPSSPNPEPAVICLACLGIAAGKLCDYQAERRLAAVGGKVG